MFDGAVDGPRLNAESFSSDVDNWMDHRFVWVGGGWIAVVGEM